ncbi:MAG: hypothetical protein SH847_11260 [Roseiflexaceae bacterium]|nr:hypothetical protein [Roseiflexaceae bacterium]
MRRALLIIGIILVFLGTLWVFQGVGIVPGSFMSGDPTWARNGTLTAIVGAVLGFFGVRRGRLSK